MKKQLLAFVLSLSLLGGAFAQNATTLPYAVNSVADIGNGPIKVRVTQGNASIFTAQGSGVGSTVGSATLLTLTSTPTTPPIVGAVISGNGITSGTTVAAYNGTTGVTLSAAMTVPASTAVAWGAACPLSAAGRPTLYIPASVMADYYLLYTQARICAVSPGGIANTILTLPIFYDSTSPASGGSGGGGTPGGTPGQIQFNSAGAFGGFTTSGDFTINTATGVGTLATANSAPGVKGSATQVPQFNVDAKGRVLTVTSLTLTPAIGNVTGLGSGVATALGNTAGGAGGFALVGTTPPTGAAGGVLSGTYPNPDMAAGAAATNVGSLGGDLTGTLPNPTLAAVISAGGPTGSATTTPAITYDAKGRLTAVSSITIAPPVSAITGLGSGISAALQVATGSAGAPSILIAKGTSAMGTSSISSAACATVVTTAATGVATTDAVNASFNGDPTASTGYVPLTAGMLTIVAYPTANNVNFKVCNNTTSAITPSAITLNWNVIR